MKPSAVWYNGENGVGLWECVWPTEPGETPDSSPEKWREVLVPGELAEAVVKLAFGELLTGEGMLDQARMMIVQGNTILAVTSTADARRSGSLETIPMRVA